MSLLIEETPKVAIVILNWNGKPFLEKFLPALVEYSASKDSKIYIADNGSTDDSVSFLKQSFPGITLILFDKNYGFTGGYNRALDQIKAKYFVILNSDVEVTPGWLEPVICYMDENELVAASQPKIRSFNQRNYFEYAGAAGGFIDKFGYPFCRGRILSSFEEDKGQYDDVREIFWATGACLFVRAELFRQAGGFDEDFFAHMEEIDLCWRLKNMGYRIIFHPESLVYHVGGGTLPNTSPRKLYLNFRNNLFLLYKNLHSSQLLSVLFRRLLLDGFSAILYLVSFKFKSFGAIFRAHIDFYKMKPIMRKKRNPSLLKLTQIDEIYNRSIVFDYFIKKRHNFKALKF